MGNNTHTSGLGLCSVLTIIFVVLKLVGVIDWSWWWVVSPTLIDIGMTTLFLIGLKIYCDIEDKNRWNKMFSDMKRGIRHDD